LDRSLDQLDIVALQGKTVAVDFYGLTPDKDFAKEFCIAWLQGRRIKVVADPSRADVFAPVLGVDQGQSFFGMPSLTVPFLGVTMPESLYSNPLPIRAMPKFKCTPSTAQVEIF